MKTLQSDVFGTLTYNNDEDGFVGTYKVDGEEMDNKETNHSGNWELQNDLLILTPFLKYDLAPTSLRVIRNDSGKIEIWIMTKK